MAREITLVPLGPEGAHSLERALMHVGASVQISSDPNRVVRARTLVLAGRGVLTAQEGAHVEGAMGAAIRMVVERGDSVLGVGLGMHLLSDGSDEGDRQEGLHVLSGRVCRLPTAHIGWNTVEPVSEHYYFMHTHFVEAHQSDEVLWATSHQEVRFPAVMKRGNVLGCQFLPERSQRAGLKFLRAFVLGGWP